MENFGFGCMLKPRDHLLRACHLQLKMLSVWLADQCRGPFRRSVPRSLTTNNEQYLHLQITPGASQYSQQLCILLPLGTNNYTYCQLIYDYRPRCWHKGQLGNRCAGVRFFPSYLLCYEVGNINPPRRLSIELSIEARVDRTWLANRCLLYSCGQPSPVLSADDDEEICRPNGSVFNSDSV